MSSKSIIEGLDRYGMESRVSLPVIITEVNEDQSLVRVQIAFKDRTMGKVDRLIENLDHQEIADVPVAHYGTNKGYIISKIEVGSQGKIIFTDLDLTDYIETGEVLDLASSRFHDWNDCYFTVGEFSYARRIDPIDADIAMASIDGTSCVAIKEGGVVELSAATELKFNAPLITVNGLAWTSTNPIVYPFAGTYEVIPPGIPKEPKEVRR